MLRLLFLISLAILPPLILLLIVWVIDKSEKEPKRLIILTFLFGALSCLPIAIVEGIGEVLIFLPQDTFMFHFINFFFVVGVAEEFGKFLMTFLWTWRNKNFNYRYDGIVYCVSTSLGFATLENLLYVLQAEYLEELESSGILTGILRCFTAIPLHCACGIIMGAFYGLAKSNALQRKNKKLVFSIILALLVPMLVHGFYDFVATILSGLLSVAVIFLIVGILFVICLSLLIIFVVNDKKILITPEQNIQNSNIRNQQYIQMQNNYMQQQMMRQQALQQMYQQQITSNIQNNPNAKYMPPNSQYNQQ